MVPAAMRLKETCSLEEKLWPTWIAYSKAETLLCQQSLSSQSYGFSSSPVWMWELDCKEGWAPKNWCFWTVVLEKTLESPLDCKEIQPVHPKGNQLNIPWKDWCWSWNSNTLATWCEELTHWKRPWCWERLKAGGEGDERGWDYWMASPTQWTWVWASLGSWWWTGKPGVLQSMGCKELDSTEWLIWTELNRTSSSEIMNPTLFTESYRFQLYIHSYFIEPCFPANACKLASLSPGAELWWTVVLDTTHFCPLPLSWGRNCRVVHLLPIPQSCAAHHNLLLLSPRLL